MKVRCFRWKDARCLQFLPVYGALTRWEWVKPENRS
jgi:hypothetical protein